MIVSMTGFGRGEAAAEGFSLTAEIKSVNSRYLDISLRLPKAVQERELQVKELIQEKVSRGKLSVTLRLDQADTGEPEITFNPRLVRGYKELLDGLREAAGIEKPVELDDLMQFSELFESRGQDPSEVEAIWAALPPGPLEALRAAGGDAPQGGQPAGGGPPRAGRPHRPEAGEYPRAHRRARRGGAPQAHRAHQEPGQRRQS
ncbi:MAG: YicC/YloC family endoribonuclease [Balneolaceae bacterium]|nr:YicC/YloC family endoribonuclease [Balneolaceae bacterium]